ncbi:DUF4097 family beta strand repeat-containing protein [Anaerocolumna sp. MB42-C2]|uniref:DUF4097 family beta strand repeat-containing protein n=1 Tax=Anaerocolumna sp. MB42-C2 TaxID=3070997 RepID=UPI0027DEB896|nr:DUF4097 family beta strand repeat-containing protein [Anaerocolumna sp. MB42-C2]WMJ86893.1 DUF4097 family beta strand repeat-containing protein [Anaerocolumna sp. MB42-C2]
MNKTEYLNILKKALKDVDESVMDEIVSDYEEHFQAGMENGKSEEQICEDLGAIDDLVEEIKEAYNTDKKENNKEENKEEKKSFHDQANTKSNTFKEWYSNIHNSIDSEKIGDAINNALDTAGDAISKIDVNEISRTLKSTLDQATSSINNFADSYFKNQGSGSYESNKWNAEGYTDNVTKSYETSEDTEEACEDKVSFAKESEDQSFNHVQTDVENENNEAESTSNGTEEESSGKNMEEPKPEADENEEVKKADKGLNLIVDGICADINVQKSSNGKVNISYVNNGNERQRQMYEFYSFKEGNTVYAGIRRVGKAVFLFNPKLNSININIELPEHMSNIDFKTASGSIKIAEINSDRMSAAAASGDVYIDRAYTTDLKIKVSSGDIRLDDINSIQLSAGTMSGDITAKNIEAKFLSMKSSSGDIKAGNIMGDVIDTSSFSGNLDISEIKAGECKFRSTSGNIGIKEFTMNNADISNISGNIKLNQIIGDGLRASSTSGNVNAEVNVKRCHASSKSGNVEVNCNGDIILESGSTSGNVNIILKNYNHGYCIKSRTTSGALYINYDNMHQRNLKTGTYSYGNQGSELTLSSVSGDIHVAD